MTTPAIEALLQESRRFPPSPEFAAQANANAEHLRSAERDYVEFWASWARTLEWMKPFSGALEWNEPFATLVRRRRAERFGQLPRPPRPRRPRRPDRVLLRRRARRPPRHHLWRAARRRLPLCQRPARARHPEGRSRRDLHADDSRTADRDARLRAHRRGAFGDLRRLLARIDRRPRQRRAMCRADHRRLRLAAREQDAAQAQLRHRDGAARRRSGIASSRGASATRSSCTRAATTGGTRSSRASRRSASPSAMNAEDLLFLLYTSGTTAKPKGIKHTTGGYLTQADHDAQARLRSQRRRRRLLVHGRYRLGNRTLVHRLWTARQRRDERAV